MLGTWKWRFSIDEFSTIIPGYGPGLEWRKLRSGCFRCDGLFYNKTVDDPSEVWQFAPENLPSQKERIVSQPFFFRGELLNFGGVSIVAPKLQVQKNTFLSLFWVAISYIQTSISYPYNFRYVRMHFRWKFLGDQVDGGSELLQLFGIFINRITCNYYL